MSATTIIDTAPLGALIHYTDGSPKRPARFTKKLAAWERSNGVGRLVTPRKRSRRASIRPTVCYLEKKLKQDRTVRASHDGSLSL